MRNWIARLALVALFFSAPALLRGQDSASLTGTVTDATGAVIPDAIVVLTNKSTGTVYKQKTDSKGSYRFLGVPPADGYSVAFAHDGFSSETVTNFHLEVGVARTQDAKLKAGSAEQVSVSAANAAVTLNTTDASIGNNTDVELLQELPIYDRTGGISTLFSLQPGVDSNQGAVTGARIDQSSVTVDGMDVNDIAAGTTFAVVSNAPIDSIEQFTGTVAGLAPAIGTGSGGQFQLVTKHGTNTFHGNINEYHRDTSTVANQWFNNFTGLSRTPLIQNQFGGNLGGHILKDKLFFFVDVSASRIVQSSTAEQTVPLPNLTGANPTLNYINNGEGCLNTSRLNTTPNCISSLSASEVAARDPAGIGFDPALLSFLAARYPAANDLTQAGDGINTGGYRFSTPTPNNSTTYVGRVDYNLSKTQHVFGRVTIARQNAIEGLPVFPTDPVTHPFVDRSYSYVVSHVWTIGANKVNQFYYGDVISKYSFPNSYNPTGADQFSFSGISSPYSGTDGQKRRVPIPEFRDDFNWQLGAHTLQAGGTFKFIKTNSNLVNNFNFVGVGQAGSVLAGGLGPIPTDPTVFNPRPTDINTAPAALNDYDALFLSSLGIIGDISTNFNYNNAGVAQPAGSGGPRAYRFFETEAYLADTWKITPKLTFSYGVRYQLYSVPYEAHGDQSIENLNGLTHDQSTIQAYVADRQALIATGNTTPNGLPFYTVTLGGKANKGPNLYEPSYKDFAPRLALSYHAYPKTVFNAGAGIVYDRTVINAINFLQDQISYLFSNNVTNQFGSGNQVESVASDPRLTAGPTPPTGSSGPPVSLTYPQSLNPVGQPITSPLTPFVDSTGQPYGLAQGDTNFVISPNLKDPYSIALNAGVQQELPWHLFLRLNYVGRLGRRLLADSDAGQVLDAPDTTGKSTQTLSQAFAGLTTQLRQCPDASCLTPQPWFENVLGQYQGVLGTNTNLVAAMVGQLGPRGDISDMLYTMATYSYYYGFTGFLPNNVGIPSQFGANAYLTNQGNSNYHGLLLTVDKNVSNGLRAQFNYTWSHSIDNTSLSANGNALFSNSGFICDITKPRACRGNSDFDVRQEISSYFIYALPIGKGKAFLASSPAWLNEVVGGWSVSSLQTFRTGLAVTPYSDTYLASFDNQDPAIFTGNKADLKSKINIQNGVVYGFKGGVNGANKVLSEFRGPIGLEYGNRNLINGPLYFSMDGGLEKVFPIIPSREFELKFRADFYNILNHPDFGTPGVNIVGNEGNFGQVGGTANSARVGQFSLRLEF